MTTSRRRFMVAAGAGLATLAGTAGSAEKIKPESGEGQASFVMHPIGRVEKQGTAARIRIFEEYAEGLVGLEAWSHINVFYWFDKNDTSRQRRTLRVHPRGNARNPLTGVFACRAPVRPNLIALSVCKIAAVKGNVIELDGIDAFDGTPVLDIKPFIPPDAPAKGVRVPEWARGGKP